MIPFGERYIENFKQNGVNTGMKQLIKLCISRKNPNPPHGRSLEIPRGRGAGS